MTERVVDNPANHGWVDAGGGKWKWAGTGADYDDTEIRGLIADNASGISQNASDIAALQALPHVDAYSKTESDAKYQLKGNYADATHTHDEYVPKSGNTTVNGILTAKDMVATG